MTLKFKGEIGVKYEVGISTIDVSDADADYLRKQLGMKPEREFKEGDKVKIKNCLFLCAYKDEEYVVKEFDDSLYIKLSNDEECHNPDHWTLIEEQESGVRSHEQKPTFKVGDKIKLKDSIDERIFTLAMCGNDLAPYTEDGKYCWVDSDHWNLIESPDEPKEIEKIHGCFGKANLLFMEKVNEVIEVLNNHISNHK